MRPFSFAFLLFAAFTTLPSRADQAGDAFTAAMKLSASPNYSWTIKREEGDASSLTRGQTSQDGYSLVTFNARPPATTSGVLVLLPDSGPETTVIFQGDSKSVIQDGNNWNLPGKAAPAVDSSTVSVPTPTPSPSAAGNRGGAGLSGGRSASTSGRRGGRSKSNGSSNNSNAPGSGPSSRAWAPPLAMNLPHEELAIIAANYTNLQFSGDEVSGKLTESGADLLLLAPGSTQTPPKGAAGSFRLWIADGNVTKYELKLTAKQTPKGEEIKGGFAETITVELSALGQTKFFVPVAAKQKLAI